MGDVVSIELLLDDETQGSVRADWEHLARAGHSSLAAHTAPSNRPHITVLVRQSLPLVDFASASALLPVRVMLGTPIVFEHGDRGVLARTVVLDEALLAVYNAVRAAVPPGEDAPHTDPDSWTPHVTLARRLRLASLDDARALLGPEREGWAVGLRRWDSRTRTVTTPR
ncbi:2'-5' RNA ligase family protein [Microbacterium lacus]|uniref:2'-5' RNA ligase family protein n=1 Tax=Microbacterium lacus TaxID=415217 RepID=UPI000C2BCEE6|nr:2'-5' RNA ligase family protein [Microbacterium lacus]